MGETQSAHRGFRATACVMLILTMALSGCSGGAGDVAAPTAAITFPGETAAVTSGHITVRGTAKDQSAVARVQVNGVDATSTDGFATWEATLDLPSGTSALTVSTEDVLGNKTAAAAATITVGPSFVDTRSIAVEPAGQLVVTDGNRVLRVDPVSGARTVVSDNTTGSGPALAVLGGIAVEATGQLVVTGQDDFGTRRVTRVDPRTGARTIVSDNTTGSGPIVGCIDIAVEATGSLVCVSLGQIVRVDPVSGARTIVSDATTGSGPSFGVLRNIAVEPTGQLVVVDGIYPVGRVMRVDPTSGARTIVSDATTGSGPSFGVLRNIAVEPTGQLVIADGNTTAADRVVRVDPTTGARTIVSDAATGGGPSILGIKGIAVEATGQLVTADGAVYPARQQRVLRVDPRSGARTIVSDSAVGSGPFFSNPYGVAVEPSGQIAVLDWTSTRRIVRVDPRSGARTIVSDDTIGSGPPIKEPLGIAVEPSGGIVVADYSSALGTALSRILRVDPLSGARSVVSDATTGAGPPFSQITGIALEPSGQIFVTEYERVLRVDPISGARTIISSATTGSGPPLRSLPYTITVEASGQLVVAGGATGMGDSVVRIDPRTGARTVLTSTPPPQGPFPPGPIHGLGRPTLLGIAVEPTGRLVVVDASSDGLRGDLVGIDPISGVRTVVSTAADFGRGIAVEASGELIALSYENSVLRVDPRNGAVAIISQ